LRKLPSCTAVALLVAGSLACSGGGSVPDAGEDADGIDAADATDADAAPETHDDGSSDTPYGWILPRCGDSLVATCADCPGLPFVCGACELSAHCVAGCERDCGGDIDCPATGTCADPGEGCRDVVFCGCTPPTKVCDDGGTVTCVDECGTQCPGLSNDFYGVCSDITEPIGGCPDLAGPEYYCQGLNPDNTGRCDSSCAECGDGYCISESCAEQFCDQGFVPDHPFYVCGKQWCCAEGYYCPTTDACVADCSACAGRTAGACGENGVCMADCAGCFRAGPVRSLQVCAGVCTDVFSDMRNCGACDSPCSGGFSRAECSAGHCCAGSGTAPPPWTWCPDCDCCVSMGILCSAANCTFGCIGP
jgi:hypothetical protein